MKNVFLFCIMLFFTTFLYAGSGMLKITANMSDVDIYNGDEQIAMLGSGETSLELKKGKYLIILKKAIDKNYEYRASKKVFIGDNSITTVNFKLEKTEIVDLDKAMEELRQAKIDYDKRVFGNSKTNDIMTLDIDYKILDKQVDIVVKSKNNAFYGKGGLDIYFPQFKTTKRIVSKKSYDFKSLKAYKANSKLWNKNKKRTIHSSYLLIEGWTKKWSKDNTKTIKLTIDTDGLEKLDFYVRTNILNSSKEKVVPTDGVMTEQGYYAKKINLNLNKKSTKTADNSDTITHKGLSYGLVKSPYTGNIWLDRNLGAKRVCQSSDDKECYGDLYQWGRAADGHEKRDSKRTRWQLRVNSQKPHSRFVAMSDWQFGEISDSLWKGVDAVNNPCPKGFEVPNIKELEQETIKRNVKNTKTAIKNFLKFPVSAYRSESDGKVVDGQETNIWSSDKGRYIVFESNKAYANIKNNTTGYGMSVRCFKKNIESAEEKAERLKKLDDLAKKENEEKMKKIVGKKANGIVAFKISKKYYPLLYALYNKNLDEAKKLILKGADVNRIYNITFNGYAENNLTLLSLAGRYFDLSTVEFLLQNGANKYYKNEDGRTIVYDLMYYNNHDNAYEMTKLLLKYYSENLDFLKNNNLLYEIIYCAKSEDRYKSVKLLLENGFNPNEKNIILNAAEKGNLKFLKLLVKYGGDLLQTNDKGENALHVSNEKEIIEYLLENGLKKHINDKDEEGNTPLFASAQKIYSASRVWKGFEILKILLKNGADIKIKNNNKDTFLIKFLKSRKNTFRKSDKRKLKYLFKNYEIDINAKNKDNKSALDYVNISIYSSEYSIEVYLLLLENGAKKEEIHSSDIDEFYKALNRGDIKSLEDKVDFELFSYLLSEIKAKCKDDEECAKDYTKKQFGVKKYIIIAKSSYEGEYKYTVIEVKKSSFAVKRIIVGKDGIKFDKSTGK